MLVLAPGRRVGSFSSPDWIWRERAQRFELEPKLPNERMIWRDLLKRDQALAVVL